MKKRLLIVGLLSICSALMLIFWPAPKTNPNLGAPTTALMNALINDLAASDFKTNTAQKAYQFPRDYGPHIKQRMELWQFNAVLNNNQQQRYGFQLSFLRLSLPEQTKTNHDSAWAMNDIYRAHFALSDQQQNKFYAFARLSRAALGLAGADASKTWLENWSFERLGDSATYRLQAEQDGVAIALQLQPQKKPVTGIEQLFAGQANALHAYTVPRLQVQGKISVAEQVQQVTGQARLEQLWGMLPGQQQGQLTINRFFIQINHNRELYLVQLQRRDGSGKALTSAWLITPAGQLQRIQPRALSMQTKRYWQNAAGLRYASAWQVNWQTGDEHIEFQLSALLDDQELPFTPRYWSGALLVNPGADDAKIQGTGHAELAAYAPVQDG